MNAFALILCLTVATPLDDATDHLKHGRYEEALDAARAAAETGADSTAVAMCVSRVQMETGQYDAAAATIESALQDAADNPDLLSRRGELRLLRGDVAGAMSDAAAAIEQDANHLAGRWVQAEALAAMGEIDRASAAYRWFVRYYNRKQPTDAESLVYVARGSLQYARWQRVSAIFHFVIGELCPDITAADSDDWRAEAISGSLLLEKYNEAQGRPELQRALAKNPNAASIHARLASIAVDDRDYTEAARHAEAALQINPAAVEALAVQVDLALAGNDLAAAATSLATANAVTADDQRLLARATAIAWLDETLDDAAISAIVIAAESHDAAAIAGDSAIERKVAALVTRNAHPGPFLYELGKFFEVRRSYGLAESAYEAAIAVMPQLSEPQVSLGLLSMRAGDLVRARTILDAAFKADPFHVRVSNMRKVVSVLESYETLETPHFVIRFDPAGDRVLAELTAEYLESAWAEQTAEFGYQPPDKTVVELFHTGRGQSGHEWFSARMVGLPWLQTVGASTGLMIALASPTSGPDYNWARVVRHELTHVVTLQQTGFRIPHWYTEALAVRSEGYPRPDQWNDLLRTRVPAGNLRTLDELNAAFTRPDSSDDWQFAYCQSLLYAEEFDRQFGSQIHRKLLDGYSQGLSTSQAIEKATNRTATEFEAGYRDSLQSIATELGPAEPNEPSAEITTALKTAAVAVRNGQIDEAIEGLEAVLDRNQPDPSLLATLGKLKLAAGDSEAAGTLFALGHERFPHDGDWLKLHAAALLKSGALADARPLLEQIANTDADDALAAKKLAELAHEAGDHAATKHWSLRALYVTPNDAALHSLLADACDALGETDRAATARRHVALLQDESITVDADHE